MHKRTPRPIVISPPAGKAPFARLVKQQRARRRNRARVARHYRRQKANIAIYKVPIGGAVIDMLIKTNWLREDRATVREEVESALARMLSDASKNFF